MTADNILEYILIEKEFFESKTFLTNEKIGCILSLNNVKILVDNLYSQTNQKKPKTVSSLSVYGMKIFPSVFIEDDYFGIFEIKTIQNA